VTLKGVRVFFLVF